MLSASTDDRTYLRFRTDPLGGTSQAELSSASVPLAVSVNGAALPASDWSYDPAGQVLMLRNLPAGMVLVRFGGH